MMPAKELIKTGGEMRGDDSRPVFIEASKADKKNVGEFRALLSATFRNYNYYIVVQELPTFEQVMSKLRDLHDLCTDGHVTKHKLQYALWISIALNEHYFKDHLWWDQRVSYYNGIVMHYNRLRLSAKHPGRDEGDTRIANLLLNPADRDRTEQDRNDRNSAGEMLDPFQMNREIIKLARPSKLSNCFSLFCCEPQFADNDWKDILRRKLDGSDRTAMSKKGREEVKNKYASQIAASEADRKKFGRVGQNGRRSAIAGWNDKQCDDEQSPLLNGRRNVDPLPEPQDVTTVLGEDKPKLRVN